MWIDRIFFGICILIAALVAFRPVVFFRAITLGRFDQANVTAGLLKTVQVISAVAAISLMVRLLIDVFQRGR